MRACHIRHGQDGLDGALTPEGRQQIMERAHEFFPYNFKRIYFSPTPRTAESAEIFSEVLKIPKEEVQGIREHTQDEAFKPFLNRLYGAHDLLYSRHHGTSEDILIVEHNGSLLWELRRRFSFPAVDVGHSAYALFAVNGRVELERTALFTSTDERFPLIFRPISN